jgi:hypothetical protein
VVVANGEKLSSKGMCKGVLIILQGAAIKVDFYLLPLGGYEVVLGAQWLCLLGPILWDLSQLIMKFALRGRQMELRGGVAAINRIVGENEINKELNKCKKWSSTTDLFYSFGCISTGWRNYE